MLGLGKACLDQNKFFVPLIISCEGLLAKEFDKAVKDIGPTLCQETQLHVLKSGRHDQNPSEHRKLQSN